MPLTIAQFLERVDACGVLAEADLAAVRKVAGEDADGDAESLVKRLHKEGKLTAYQAQALWKGKGQPLALGNYLVEDELGRGGMGVVLKARHKRMHRKVAVKVLSAALVKDAAAIARFQREVVAAAKLTHPNIVAAFDADEINGQHILVMEFVDGRDLSSIVSKQGPMPVAQGIDCILQAARGLEFAHKRGVIHRDIKPANLLLDAAGTVKILDMGLARLSGDVGSQAELTGTGTVMGTVDYMSPEQALNSKTADHRSDIYSLGISLFYLLTGKPAYEGDSMMARLMAHSSAPIPSLVKARVDAPSSLHAVFEKMIAKKVEERYQSAADVIADLEACRSGTSATATQVRPRGKPSDSSDQLWGFLDESTASASDVTRPAAKSGQRTVTAAAQPTLITRGAVDEETSPTPGTGKGTGHKQSAATAWWTDWRVLAGAGAAILLLIVALIASRPSAEPPVIADEAVAAAPPTAPPDSGASPPAPMVAVASPPRSTSVGGAPSAAVAPFDAAQARAHQEAWAKYLGVPVEFTNPPGMEFVLIPPGEFIMGISGEDLAKSASLGNVTPENEKRMRQTAMPSHRVTLTRPYWISPTEVTIAQFEEFVAATRYVTDAERLGGGNSSSAKVSPAQSGSPTWRSPGFDVSPASPVCQVTWNDASAFCRWRSEQEQARYRLPTEAEWEFACRAGSTTLYSFGDDPALLSEHAWFQDNSSKQAQPVATRRPNSFGLFDMHGNMTEWCLDVPRPVSELGPPEIDPVGLPSGGSHSLRGGNWGGGAHQCRSTSRINYPPAYRWGNLGFRIVKEVGASEPAAAISMTELLTSPDYEWTEPENLGPAVNTDFFDEHPELTPDGLTLWLSGGGDLHLSKRSALGQPFPKRRNAGRVVNGDKWDSAPALSLDGTELIFQSARGNDLKESQQDLWLARRTSPRAPFTAPVLLPPAVNSESDEAGSCFSSDGLTLLLSSWRSGGFGNCDLWQVSREGPRADFGHPVNLGPNVNNAAGESDPWLSTDGLVLLFSSNRSGGAGGDDLYFCTRSDPAAPFARAVSLGPVINSSVRDSDPFFYEPEQTLYFASHRPGGLGQADIWTSRRVPKVRSTPPNAESVR